MEQTPEKQVDNRTLEECTADWSAEDRAWLEKHVQEHLRLVAARYGRKLFSLVIIAGSCSFALNILASQTRGNRKATQAIQVAQNNITALVNSVLYFAGESVPKFLECRENIDLIISLQDAGQRLPGERVSAGGIVLDS
jgi:protein involved in temperature-dependent protein secretion